jgi:hypothetical protein
MAHRAAFRRMYGFELDMMVSTSGKRSRAISTEAMFPSVQSARPTMYWLEWFRSLFSLAFSASCRTWLRTSWLSWSPRSRPPGSHPVATWSPDTPSVCPQNAGRPVTLDIRSVQNECECMSFLSRGLNTPHVGIVALFPKAGANSSALLLHHSSLVGNRFRSSHIPNELLHCVVLVYTCMASVAILAYTKSLWWPLGPHRGGGRNVKQVRARESWRCRDARVGRLLEPNALAIWYGTAAG